jgi:hypothetical protein
VVVFLQGVCTQLGGPADSSTFNDLKGLLKTNYGYAESDFLMYSYRGGTVFPDGGWSPNAYGPTDPAATDFRTDGAAQLHNRLIIPYAAQHPDVRFILVGHSLGGVVAMEEVRQFAARSDANAKLLTSVITVDSPILGVSQKNRQLVARLSGSDRSCVHEGVAVDNLAYLYANRETYSIELRNAVATLSSSGVKVVNTGNKGDCVINPVYCDRVIGNIPMLEYDDDTVGQWLFDSEARISVFDIDVDCLTNARLPWECVEDSHIAALSDQVSPESLKTIADHIGNQLVADSRPAPSSTDLLLVSDPLTSPQVLDSFECRTGRGSHLFQSDGLHFVVAGRCLVQRQSAWLGKEVPNLSMVDGELSLGMRFVSGMDRSFFRVSFRQDSQKNTRYFINFDPRKDRLELRASTDGEGSRILTSWTNDGRLSWTDWNTYSIVVLKDQLAVKLNGSAIMNAVDNSYDSGVVYLALYRDSDIEDETRAEVVLRDLQVFNLANTEAARLSTYGPSSPPASATSAQAEPPVTQQASPAQPVSQSAPASQPQASSSGSNQPSMTTIVEDQDDGGGNSVNQTRREGRTGNESRQSPPGSGSSPSASGQQQAPSSSNPASSGSSASCTMICLEVSNSQVSVRTIVTLTAKTSQTLSGTTWIEIYRYTAQNPSYHEGIHKCTGGSSCRLDRKFDNPYTETYYAALVTNRNFQYEILDRSTQIRVTWR